MSWIKEIYAEAAGLPSDARTLRKNGWVVGGVLFAMGVGIILRGGTGFASGFLIGVAVPLIFIAFVRPERLKQPYKLWMTLALLLGAVMSRIILTLFFIGILTPLAFLARLFRKSFLDLGFRSTRKTYWIRRETGAGKDYRRMF